MKDAYITKCIARHFAEERGQRAGVGPDHRCGHHGAGVAVAVGPGHLLLLLQEGEQRCGGPVKLSRLCHFQTN